MANKQALYTFGGITQDTTKYSPEYYFEGQHIRIIATDSQSTGALTNEVGNTSVVTLPSLTIDEANSKIIYGTSSLTYTSSNEIADQIASGLLPTSSSAQVIIGHIETRTGLALWTTDDAGFDCIWYIPNILDGTYNLQLLYVRNFGFSTDNPIQAVFNFENENIQKVYWVDGYHQIRYLNLTHNQITNNIPLIDVPLNTIDFVGNVYFSQPIVTDIIAGGSHTSGMIQYAYNLYRLNGSQTKLSPLSEIVPLDKGPNLGGGALDEIMAATPVVTINNIDQAYTNIKVYAVKYTSLNEIPSIYLIKERELTGSTIVVYDDGSTIESVSLDEFLFLGSEPSVPKHIEAKDSRLFLANIQENAFELPEELDMRAYSFNISSATTKVWRDPVVNNGTLVTGVNSVTVPADWNFDLKHPSINLEYRTRRYQQSSTTPGGTGKYCTYELVSKTAAQLEDDPSEYRFFKDEELYRIGIEFYNNLGQTSPPKWIADFRAGEGNLIGNYNTLKVTLTAAFYTWLNTYNFESGAAVPVGYRIIRADRTPGDRTILCQGALTQMFVQNTEDKSNYSRWEQEPQRVTASNGLTKIPIPVTRGFVSNVNPLNRTYHLKMMNELSEYGSDSDKRYPNEEIYSGVASSTKRQQSWQYTKMFQMQTPEVLFDTGVSFNSSIKMNIKGVVKRTATSIWMQWISSVNGTVSENLKTSNVTTSLLAHTNIHQFGLFGPSNKSDEQEQLSIYREWNDFYPSSSANEYEILGTPEITERQAGPKNYAGRGEFQYTNTMEGFLTDEQGDDVVDNAAIVTMNSAAAKCITLVQGSSTATLASRKTLETIRTEIGATETDCLLLAELFETDANVAVGNMYGGNNYEDRSRTNYIGIGVYNPIATTSVEIDNPGDTYVYDFKFARIAKLDVENTDDQALQLTEIVSFPVETTVDLKNRNDLSLQAWDSLFQPTYTGYTKYNRVYSQQPTLIGNASVDFNFRRIKGFDTRVQATKLKIPNESVDNWTDVLESEKKDLDGKYGAINGLITFNDKMIAFQDNGICDISINPRIQVTAQDGVGIELGKGAVIYDHNYISTTSGSINKWSIISTKTGIYYYDALNKAIGRVPDAMTSFLSNSKGLHHYFNNNYNYNLLKVDNPLKDTGVVFGYDNFNSDVYFTFLQGDSSFTRCFNEARDEFVDLKTYLPSRYISKGDKLLLPNTEDNQLWESFSGETNNFFGVSQPSYVTLQLKPESYITAVFDNIFFNSEISIDDVDQPELTLTHIHAFSEWQDSGRIPLIVGRDSNLRRRFRNWRANIPRDGRARIRNPWIYLKLELDQSTNQKLILYDIILNYTV
ncbi:MAG: hypothetical protein ACSLE0_23485 [Chitinophagaceae bacterium]